MPKERFHLLAADQSLQVLTSRGSLFPFSEGQKLAYFGGAISPDSLFYDLPSFRLSWLGSALHERGGKCRLDWLKSILQVQSDYRAPEAAAWLLGAAGHLFVDAFWHPFIEKMSPPDSLGCRGFKPSESECHHWLESELEGYWMARIGPSDGYLPIMKQFAGAGKTLKTCVSLLRATLTQMGFDELPSEEKIGRCFFWQATLLRQFSSAFWGRWRRLFLDHGSTRLLGALISPATSDTWRPASVTGKSEHLNDLFDADLMVHSVISLAGHLQALAGQHRLCRRH
jgi:hypothetical protein